MENHHVQWVNPLFLWPVSLAMQQITRGWLYSMFYTSNPEKMQKKHPYKENFKSAQALAQVWQDLSFSKIGWLIIFHLFQLRMAVLIPKQDRPMATHGWRILYHFMEMCQQCLVIDLLCLFCLLVLCIFSEKITRFISVSNSDRLTVPPSGPLCTSTASASPIGISAGAFLSEKW